MKAQMFSVGEEEGPRFNSPRTEIYLGTEPMNVTYEGDDVIPGGADPGLFEFEGPIIRAGYNSPSFDFFVGTGGKITGLDEVSYFDIGGNIDFGINLYRSNSFAVLIPFRIASRFTNMTNSDRVLQGFDRFRFGSLTAGAGARILARPQNNIRFEVGAIPSFGFSFATGGLYGGSMGSVAAGARVYFDRLFGDFGVSLGYKFDLRNYDVDEDLYDYKMTGHCIELGVTF